MNVTKLSTAVKICANCLGCFTELVIPWGYVWVLVSCADLDLPARAHI